MAIAALTAIAAAAPAANAACANEALRQSQASAVLPQGSTYLPACMAFEMVTPPKKFGQETLSLTAFSADGQRALFVSKAALADTPGLQFFGGDNYVASRGNGGWVTSPTSPPRSAEISAAGNNQGGPFAFDPDLDSWVSLGATQVQASGGKSQLFSGALGGAFGPLSPELIPINNSGEDKIFLTIGSGQFFTSGTAADLSAVVFTTAFSALAFLPEDPRETKGATNSYLAFLNAVGQPDLQLLARDQTGKVWGGRCGSFLGGGVGGLNQGALSPDAARIYFTTRPAQAFDPTSPAEPPSPDCDPTDPTKPLRIMLRSGEGPEIKELIPGEPTAPGDDLYQAASQDGTKVFLTSPRKLTASDQDTSSEACSSTLGSSKGCDLYLYDSTLPEGSRLIQASAGGSGDPTPGKGADVLSSITAVSADGSHAYFAAQGVLTTDPNPQGATAVAGQPNLYLYERNAANPGGRTAFLGTLSAGDKGSLWGGEHSLANNAYPVPLLGSGDGHVLFFLSKAQLTTEDSDGTGADVYRYDSSGTATLQCVSCAAGGDSSAADAFAGSSTFSDAEDGGSSSNLFEFGRWASDDGQTAAFATAAPLVPGDEDEDVNAYLWREGQLYELPSKVIGDPRPFKLPTVSPSGNEVGFTTLTPILPVDGDTAKDAYVVRVDGGFPNPVAPNPCDPFVPGSCRGAGTSAGTIPAPVTPTFIGPGNPKEPAKCKKGQVRKKGKCVKKKSGKKKSGKSKKRAGNNQGGSK